MSLNSSRQLKGGGCQLLYFIVGEIKFYQVSECEALLYALGPHRMM